MNICKCGARTERAHQRKTSEGYPAHTYKPDKIAQHIRTGR